MVEIPDGANHDVWGGDHTNRGEIPCTVHYYNKSLNLAKTAKGHEGFYENALSLLTTSSGITRDNTKRQTGCRASEKRL